MKHFDVIVLGGGIAGASVAAALAEQMSVAVLEIEDRLGRHSTGRTAALFAINYGNDTVRALTRASQRFFESPPDGFSATALLHPRGVMHVADASRRDRLHEIVTGSQGAHPIAPLQIREALARCPLLRPEWLGGAAYDPAIFDLEVAAVHQGFLSWARARGAEVVPDARHTRLERRPGQWRVETAQGAFGAPIVVNATGAWAGAVGRSVGASEIGLVPMRRTCVLIPPPASEGFARWPMVLDVDEDFYFKPESTSLLLCPGNEDPSEPCDAVADELDVAIAVDRFERATLARVDRITHRWAGLRSFAGDRSPVVGFDPLVEGFFWLAGQGGFGIQTAPALARVAAALIRGEAVPSDVAVEGIEAADLAPGRLC